MARYTGAVCRLCRREGQKLFLKGERCYSEKCSVGIRGYAPGQHGQGRKKSSEYGMQLRAKQTARRFYGVQDQTFFFPSRGNPHRIHKENSVILKWTIQWVFVYAQVVQQVPLIPEYAHQPQKETL